MKQDYINPSTIHSPDTLLIVDSNAVPFFWHNKEIILGKAGQLHRETEFYNNTKGVSLEDGGVIRGRIGRINGNPIVTLWQASQADLKEIANALIEKFPILNRNTKMISNHGQVRGTLGNILNNGDSIDVNIDYNGHKMSLGSIISSIHTLSKVSPEYQKIKSWVCQNWDRYPQIKTALAGRIKCDNKPVQNDPHFVDASLRTLKPEHSLSFKEWLLSLATPKTLMPK